MPILPSKEKRRIYTRKIKTFWQDFSHNKIGLVGLAIIIFYVVVAVFAEEIAPYPPVATPRASSGFAMPAWITIFPQYSNLPPTIQIPLNWTPTEQYEAINMDYTDYVAFNYTAVEPIGTLQNYTFYKAFNYTYDPCRSFEVSLSWRASFSNLSYRLELSMVLPDGREYPLFGEDYDLVTRRVRVLEKSWNITIGNWLTTSGSEELRIRTMYETLYAQKFQEEYDKYLQPLEEAYYNSTFRIQNMTFYRKELKEQQTLWKQTHNNSLVGFNEFWYGPDGYWNTTGVQKFNEFWYGPDGYWNTTGVLNWEKESLKYAAKAAEYADPLAKDYANQQSRMYSPAAVFFSNKGTFQIKLTFFVQPLSEQAQLRIDFDKSNRFRIWGSIHGIMGSDSFGKDVFTQLVYGARISLIVGLLSALLSTSLGIFFGVSSGYLGGLVDEVTMRIVDILLCLPVLPILLALMAYFKPNVYFVVLLIAIFGWQGLSRVIRSRVLSIREMPFVESARASGASNSYLIVRHLIPNVFPIAIASMILAVPGAILTEAALSFLGFGDPLAPTWGKMLHEAQTEGAYSVLAWWYILPPGFAITMLCVAFVFLGHALDEIVNPRLRRRR